MTRVTRRRARRSPKIEAEQVRDLADARQLVADAKRDVVRRPPRRTTRLWLADGTNYPGQDDLRGRHARLVAGLETLYAELPEGMRLLVEYKFFEQAFYSTDLPDWGTAAPICRRLGSHAPVLVDTGHHAQGTNVEQIVAVLLRVEQGLEPDPVAAFRAQGHRERLASQRGTTTTTSAYERD